MKKAGGEAWFGGECIGWEGERGGFENQWKYEQR